jgi:hypothetical protein
VELGGRDDEEAGRGGLEDVAVANSRVATSSEPTGVPQEEQKRTAMGKSTPQELQVANRCSAGIVYPDKAHGDTHGRRHSQLEVRNQVAGGSWQVFKFMVANRTVGW